jgi:hypothetical protein
MDIGPERGGSAEQCAVDVVLNEQLRGSFQQRDGTIGAVCAGEN